MKSTNELRKTTKQTKEAVQQTAAGKKSTSKPVKGVNKKRKMMLHKIIALILIVALVLLVLSFFKDSHKIGGAKIENVSTYKSKNRLDPDKQKTDTFSYGDPIQVGVEYDADDIDESKALVSFVVYDRNNGSEVFKTNKFRLMDIDEDLFVSINNTNLPVGEYRVEVRDADDKKSIEVEYSIKD